jgi:chaperonin GroEL
VGKDTCTIVGDGSTQEQVAARVRAIRNLCDNTEQEYEKEKLNERIARLSGGVAIIQVCTWGGRGRALAVGVLGL